MKFETQAQEQESHSETVHWINEADEALRRLLSLASYSDEDSDALFYILQAICQIEAAARVIDREV